MELFFKKYGKQGPPLIILHGLLGASGNWHTLSRDLFGKHFQVYAVDQRNHGRSPHSGPFDYGTLAEDTRDFMDQQGLDAAHLLGHSMGGKTVMETALRFPERVQRLVVADMAPKAYPPHHRPILRALQATDPSHYESRKEIDAALASTIKSRPVRQFLLKNLQYDGEHYQWQMNLDAIAQSYDAISGSLENGRQFEGPTLFLSGEKSDYISEEDKPEIRTYFPSAKFKPVSGAGHWLHADQPEAFGRAVVEFLADGGDL